MKPRLEVLGGTACTVLRSSLHAPDGHRRLVLEVDCPNHARPVPIRVCMACHGYQQLALEGHMPRVVCTPAVGDGARMARASSMDTAQDLMHRPLTLHAQASLAAAEHLLQDAHQPAALVVDHDSHVLGVLNAEDVRHLRETGEFPDGEWMKSPPADIKAADVARPLLVWVTPRTPVRHISMIMAQTHQRRVVVIGPDGLVGEVTVQDVERWFSHLSTAGTMDSSPPKPA